MVASLLSIHQSTPYPILSNRPEGSICFSGARNVSFQLKKPSFFLNSAVSTVNNCDISPKVERFWEWLKDEGVVSAKTPVKPGAVPEGLGLIATRDISRNEVILEVPKKFWINSDTVAASEIGRICSDQKPWVSISLFLLMEKLKGEDSKWSNYLDTLPQVTNSTIYWSEEELHEIQGTQLLGTTRGVKAYVENEFERIKEEIILPNKQLFPQPPTVDDFYWAFGMLRSMAFPRPSLTMVPFADLINHSAKVDTEDHAHEVRGPGLFSRDYLYQIRSPLAVKAGDQVFIQYGLDKSNSDMALDYGFIDSRGDRDAFTLTLELSESDKFYDNKLDIAESNGLGETAHFDIKYGQPFPPGMLQYLRLIALGGTDAFLLEALYINSLWELLELPISRDNEELICRVIRNTCKSTLSSYHTTIEEDEKLLLEGNLSPRMEIAVGIRRGEKRVLQQIDDIFKGREMELNLLEYYQERRLKSVGVVGEQGEIIFWETR